MFEVLIAPNISLKVALFQLHLHSSYQQLMATASTCSPPDPDIIERSFKLTSDTKVVFLVLYDVIWGPLCRLVSPLVWEGASTNDESIVSAQM